MHSSTLLDVWDAVASARKGHHVTEIQRRVAPKTVLKYPVQLLGLQGSEAISKSNLLHIIYGFPGGAEEGWCCGLSLIITPSSNGRELMGNQCSLWKT